MSWDNPDAETNPWDEQEGDNQDWNDPNASWDPNAEWVDPNAEVEDYLINDAYMLEDDPWPTDNQLWEIGGREDAALAADPKEYIMKILEHDMDEVKDGGFPGLRAYIRLACTWKGEQAIPYAQKLFKNLLDKSRDLADKTINVGDKRKMLNCLLGNFQTAKLKYPADSNGAGLGMMWEMLMSVLMREASDYTRPDPEECVPVGGAAAEGAVAENLGQWPFKKEGLTSMAPAVVLRLEKPNDSGWYKVSKWLLETAVQCDWPVKDRVKDSAPLSWLPLHLCFISSAEDTEKRRYEFAESIRNLCPSGSLSSVDEKVAIAKLMSVTILLRQTEKTHPDRQSGLLTGADFNKADKAELISRLPGLMLVNKQISAGAAAGFDMLVDEGTAVDRYEKRMRIGPWMTELLATVKDAHVKTNKDIADSLNIMSGAHELAYQTEELMVTMRDLIMMSHLSTLIVVEDAHYTAIPKFKPRKQLPMLKPLHTTSKYGDWKKLQLISLWDSSNMIRSLLRGRIKPKRRMMGGFGGMDEDDEMAMAIAASMGQGGRGVGKGGKNKEEGVNILVCCDKMPKDIFARIILGCVVEYEDGQEHLEYVAGDDRAPGMMNFSMPGGRRKKGGRRGRRGRGGMMGGMHGFDMGFDGEGGEASAVPGLYSGYLLKWKAPQDPAAAEADKKNKKPPPMIEIQDTPLRGPVSGEEFQEAPKKEPEAMPPCRAGKVIHSNPWRWPNLWDDEDDSTHYQYYLWGASMMNYASDHAQQLNGSGMAGLLGASRGIGHFRYIGIPVNPQGFSDAEFQQAVAAQFAKVTGLLLAGNDVHVPEHWLHSVGMETNSKRGGMMDMMMGGGGGGSSGTVVYTLEKQGSCGLVAPASLDDVGRIHVSQIMGQHIAQLEAVATARAEPAYDATTRETLLQLHDSQWRERFQCVSSGEFDFANIGTGSVADTVKVAENMTIWLKHLASLRATIATVQPAWNSIPPREGRDKELERMQDHVELNLELGLLAFRHIHALTHHAQVAVENERNSLKGDERARRDLALVLLADAEALLGGMIGSFVQNFPAFHAQFSAEFDKAPAQFEFLMKAAIRSFFLAGAHEGAPTSEWIKIAFQAQASRFRKAEGVMTGEADPVVAKAGSVKITKLNAETADPGTWLTSDIMNFWFAVLEVEAKEKKTKAPMMIQPTTALMIASAGTTLESLSWMDDNFLSSEIVVVPVSDSDGRSGGEHWSSLIYNKETNGLYVMDSMGIGDVANEAATKYAKKFQAYLTSRGREGATISVLKIPKQGNTADCGVYSCAIADIAAKGDLGVFFDPAKLTSALSGASIAGMRARLKGAVQEYGGSMKGKEFVYDGVAAGAAPEAPEEQSVEARVMELNFLVNIGQKEALNFLQQVDGSVEKVIMALFKQQQKKSSFMPF